MLKLKKYCRLSLKMLFLIKNGEKQNNKKIALVSMLRQKLPILPKNSFY
jgi:hypothetical protein